MILRTKKVILWIPTIVLVITALIVLSIVVGNNSQRIGNLENSTKSSTITFTFDQNSNRFRIICNQDEVNLDVYVCTTIRIGPTPTPTPTKTGG